MSELPSGELESAAQETEFDTVAGWTEEAVRALGPEHAVPAGCRGSGSEGALRWLADRLDLAPGDRLLDIGSGVGGPAGWLAAERGVRPLCAEPMAAAARASSRLFGLPAVVAVSQRLPLADGAVRAAWCLGVLCTTADQAGLLAEARRLLDGAGLALTDTAQADLADSPPEWSERADAVDAEVRRRHGADPRLAEAHEQARRVGRLLRTGSLRPWLGVATAS